MGLLDLALGAAEPWYIRWPLGVLGGVKAGLAWLVATPLRLALAAAVLLGLALGWQVQGRRADAGRAAAAQARLLAAFAREQHAYGVLAGALATQNGAIRQWQLAGEIRHQTATRALRAAERAGKPLIAAADALDAEAAKGTASAPAADCHTPAGVLAQEGEL